MHENSRGHTMFMLGGSAVTSFSKKQMLNADSSVEGELIGVDNELPQILLA